MTVYARAGVAEAWIVDPVARTIEVRDLKTGASRLFRRGERAASKRLAGFEVDVSTLFAE